MLQCREGWLYLACAQSHNKHAKPKRETADFGFYDRNRGL
jgi:hypothetical protein